MSTKRIACTICGAMILPDTFHRYNGMCAQCVKNPAYAKIKADYAQAKSEGRNLKDETDDSIVLFSILQHEIETGQHERVEDTADTYRMPNNFEIPATYQQLLTHEAITVGESFGCCDLEWIEPAPLIKVALDGIDHKDLRESIINNLKGFESYVAFAWKVSGEYYCWDADRLSSDKEYMICLANSGISHNYAPTMPLFLLREVIENAYAGDADDQVDLDEAIQAISCCISAEIVSLMRDLNAQLRKLDYDFDEYEKLIARYIGELYLPV